VCGYVKQYPDIYPKINPLISREYSPVVYVSPTKDEIKTALYKFFDVEYRVKSSEEARRAYYLWCDPQRLTMSLVRFVENWEPEFGGYFEKIYSELVCDPNKIVYYHGCGIDANKLRRILRRVREIRPDFVFGDRRTDLVEVINKWLDGY